MTQTTGSTVSRERAREAMVRFLAAWEQGDVSAVVYAGVSPKCLIYVASVLKLHLCRTML